MMKQLSPFLPIERLIIRMENGTSHLLQTFNALAVDARSEKSISLRCIYRIMTTIVLIAANELTGNLHRKSMKGGLNNVKGYVGQ